MINTQLHCHTHGSNLRMLDCIVKTNDLIDRAIEIGAKAVAITDHASLSEHIKAIQKAKQLQKDGKDIKVLLGDEIYLVDDVVETRENYRHLDYATFSSKWFGNVKPMANDVY